MKILLTNIGNRNLLYDGKIYQEQEFALNGYKPMISFKEWTLSLLNDWDNVKEKLDVNIINPLISDNIKYDLVVIFYSDQSSLDTRTDQDTIHEASLISLILRYKYNFTEDKIMKIGVNVKVIDNGALLNFYRLSFIKLKKLNPDLFFTICDAGGTAQQKMALKVIAEFVLKPDQYEVLYVEKNSLITDVNVNEYRTVINSEQAIILINQAEYQAASELLGLNLEYDNKIKYSWQTLIFLHTYYRFNNNSKLATLVSKKLPKIKNEILLNYIDGEAHANNLALKSDLGKPNFLDLTDLLYKAIFYFKINKFSLSVLAFAHFYERFFSICFSIFYNSQIFGSKYKQSQDQYKTLVEEVENYYGNFLKNNPNFRVQIDSIMVQILLLKVCESDQVRKISSILSPYFSHTDDSLSGIKHINSLRNEIAHNGTIFTVFDMTAHLFYYEDLLNKMSDTFCLKSKNLFLELNNLIENNLRT